MTREEGRSAGTGGFSHEPVMCAEVVDLLMRAPEGLVVDATLGGGGHAAGLLSASAGHSLLGIDRDEEAVRAARRRLAPYGARAAVVQARFDGLAAVVHLAGGGRPVTGVLFDLGVSSHQLDEPSRGFSYRHDGPLDMRMDRSGGATAAEIVNSWPEADLVRLFAENGEGRHARRIARTIQQKRPLSSTMELAELIRECLPGAARRRGGHPAKRVFQALRIAVNEELLQLGEALEQALELLVPSGRLVAISYHSGEDRVVKDLLAGAASGWCRCPPHLPCVCGAVPQARLLWRGARKPLPAEVASNPRARSARLRAAERLPPGSATESPRASDRPEPPALERRRMKGADG